MPGENATRGEEILVGLLNEGEKNELMKFETSLGGAGAVLAPSPSPASLPPLPFCWEAFLC